MAINWNYFMPDGDLPENSPNSAQLPLDFGYVCSVCGRNSKNSTDFIFTTDWEPITYCSNCGKTCVDCHQVDKAEEMVYMNRNWYCSADYNKDYITCPNCQEIVERSEYLKPSNRNTYSMKNGGCTECSTRCSNCKRVVDNDNIYNVDDDSYCEDCYSDSFTTCEQCNETISNDDAHYAEDVGTFCSSCYKDKFTDCEKCNKTIEKEDASELDGDLYCSECFEILSQESLKEFEPLMENFQDFSWSKKDRVLNKIIKLVPISVRDLKSKHLSLANSLQDLIVFAQGKDITMDIVNAYREAQGIEEFPVEYGTWTELQRSIEHFEELPVKTPQLVLKIIASDKMLASFKANPALYDLFNQSNLLSNKSGHPHSEDQIGWARLELDPNKNFILVDEIQCDHQNAANRLAAETYGQTQEIRKSLQNKYKLDTVQFNTLLKEYSAAMKNFPDIATEAVSHFAKKNGYKKLYWHTYESGKALKKNEPPRSLYEKVPKENFFLPTDERPFDLPGQFLAREASERRLQIISRNLQLKNILRKYN